MTPDERHDLSFAVLLTLTLMAVAGLWTLWDDLGWWGLAVPPVACAGFYIARRAAR